ncbi:hypothetical protein MPL3365_10157 [Mesorhizobium plurifarium]|uniref:Uncharacterized protein n=1 Tax=Mesorhizobium plurifarium TaxID=69974 RepID=A0A090FT84_MESPL|nr:hypothetical protein MPL3365_10157 [Mesorhizobium plurifarium]
MQSDPGDQGLFRQFAANLADGPQRRLRCLEQAEHVIALRVDEVAAVLGDDPAYRVETIRDLTQGGIVADALIERHAAYDIGQEDCGQKSFLIHRLVSAPERSVYNIPKSTVTYHLYAKGPAQPGQTFRRD